MKHLVFTNKRIAVFFIVAELPAAILANPAGPKPSEIVTHLCPSDFMM
jgi:hypothetical protein